jgi:hypothetical protein
MLFRAIPYLFLLGSFALPLTCSAQDRGYNDGLYYGLRLLGESDGAFTLKREQPMASYAFRYGMGPQLLYVKNLSKRVGWGMETGGWLFWNKDADMDDLHRSFHRRAVVLPLLANVHVSLINTPRFGIFLQASGGLAYTQTIHRYDGRSRVEQNTTGLYGLTAVIFIGLYKIKLSPGYYAGHRLGTSYFNLGGSTVHSVFLPVLLGDRRP